MRLNHRLITSMCTTTWLVLIVSLWTPSTWIFAADADAKQVTFEGITSQYKWTLKDINPELPADWSSYDYLVIELMASSPQRFLLSVYNNDGTRRLMLQPFGQGVWIRASVPLSYFQGKGREGFDLASAGNKSRKSFWIGLKGPFGPLNSVDALGVTMQHPVGKPMLEIRSVRVAKEDPGSDILDKLPVVDEFGQWIAVDWPGKIGNLDQLKDQWAEEEKNLGSGGFNYCPYGGYMGKKVKDTGFFRVEQIDGRWWFVDPDGHLFFSTGVNGIGTGAGTQTEGRESYFAALPPADLMPPGPSGFRVPSASFYTWNLLRRFGPDWREKWIDLTLKRMDAWGLNTIGNWSDQRFYTLERKPYVVTLRGWAIETGYLGMPDVYSDEWAKTVDQAAEKQCAPRKNDPYLLGYFVANEPPWPGRENELVNMILAGRQTSIQNELKGFLEKGDTPERRKKFVHDAFEKFITTVNAAIRKYDPNHLNLGIRFGGHVSDEIVKMGGLFDVYSLNIYAYEPTAEVERAYKIAGRPVIIGEFHIGAPGNGLAAGLVQARDQTQRGVAYRYYAEQAAALPGLIGLHWFQWLDQPVTGRRDGENYNIGFIDVTDRPYIDFIEGVKATHKRLSDVHSGKEPPTTQKAIIQ